MPDLIAPLNLPPVSPAFARLRPPIIVVGMHRSGTSMVAGMLDALGVFIDPDLNEELTGCATPPEAARSAGYGEAVAFRLLNESIMSRADSTWDNVTSYMDRRDKPRFAEAALKSISQATHTVLKTGFLDRCPALVPRVWGWKDPRNSLTLPFWLALFSEARILHVTRNPEKIVDSLLRREDAPGHDQAPPSKLSRLRGAASDPSRVVRGIRRRLGITPARSLHMDRDAWHELTDIYVSECRKHAGHPGGYHEISFESIVQDPERGAEAIAEFADVCVPASQIARAASFVIV